jgi:hypothetical protein
MNIYATFRIPEIAASIIRTETAIPTETLVLFLDSSCQMPRSISHYATNASFHTQINYSLKKGKAIPVRGRGDP